MGLGASIPPAGAPVDLLEAARRARERIGFAGFLASPSPVGPARNPNSAGRTVAVPGAGTESLDLGTDSPSQHSRRHHGAVARRGRAHKQAGPLRR